MAPSLSGASLPSPAALAGAVEQHIFGHTPVGEAFALPDPEFDEWHIGSDQDEMSREPGAEKWPVFLRTCQCATVKEDHDRHTKAMTEEFPEWEPLPLPSRVGGHYVYCLRVAPDYAREPSAALRLLAAVGQLGEEARERFRMRLRELVASEGIAYPECDLMFHLSPQHIALAALAAVEAPLP